MKQKFKSAIYNPNIIEEYQGNPLIEALPPFVENLTERLRTFTSRNVISEEERNLPPMIKIQKLSNISKEYVPMNWSVNVSVSIDLLIREGYRRRNPLSREHLATSYDICLSGCYDLPDNKDPVGCGFLSGSSGMGKTSTVVRHLSRYPQVLEHDNYNGIQLHELQVTWLLVNTPSDGSIKGFCTGLLAAFDTVLGTDYMQSNKRASIDYLSDLIAKLCNIYNLGILIIDECQNLLNTRSGKERLTEFINILSNKVGVPFYFIGTPNAQKLKEGSFHLCRRLEAKGSMTLAPYQEDAPDWQNFIHTLCTDCLYLKNPQLTPEIYSALYQYSAGIPAVAKALIEEVQEVIFINAAATGEETLTTELIQSVAKERFPALQDNIENIHNGNFSALIHLEDWLTQDLKSSLPEKKELKVRKDNPQHEKEDLFYLLMIELGCEAYLSQEQIREQARRFSSKIDPGLKREEYLPILYKFVTRLIDENKVPVDNDREKESLESFISDVDSLI